MIAVVGVLSGILIAAKIQADAKARIERSLKEHLNLSSMVLDNIAAEKNSSMDPKGAAYAARALESNPQFLPAIERARALILRSSPSPDLIYSSPNLIYGPSMIGDNLILIDSTGELQIIDSTGTQIRTRKLDGRIEMGNASRGGQAIAWLSTTELDQRSKGEDPSTDGEANSDEENSAQASAGDSSDSMNAERSPDAVKKKDLEANQRRATQEEEEPKFRLHRLDLQTGQLTASAIIDSRVSSICVSSDGSKVLLVTLEGILKVWNGKSNESARTVFNTKEIRPKLLQASAKGGWLAIGHSEEGHPVLITVAAEEAATHTTLAYAEPIVDFLESSCGTRIMARDEEGEVMVFNTRGLLLRKVNAKGSVRIMGIDSLGLTYITVNDDNLAEFWNVLDGEPCRPARVLSQASRPVNILDQGRYLIAAESDGSIYRYQSGWNPGSADSREIARFGAESNDLFLLPSSPVGKVLAIATDDHRIHFLDPETGDPRREAVKLGGEPIPLIPLPGNDRLLAGGGSSVWLVPVSPDQEPQEFKLQPDSALSHSVVDLVVSPDTQAFHVLTNTGVLETHRLDDPKAAAKSREFPDESGKRLIISPAGVEPWLAMTTHLPTQRQWLLRVFRMEDDVPGKVFVEWTSNSEIWTMVSDPGGRWLAALTWDGTISVFDLASDDPANEGRRTLNLGSSAYNAAFLVGGDRPVLVTGDSQGQLSRWDVIDAKARRDEFVNPCPETVTSLTLSPSGKWLACTTFSGRAVIWDTSTGFAKMLPITHAARIWSFAFDESTNPVRVYTSSRDGHIKVTDLDLGIVQNENDVINMARILQWQSGQIIDRAGGASALGPHEREALLNEAAKDGVSDLYKWATTPPWERGQRPGEQPNAPAEPSLDWEDRRFPSPWRHAYDRDPEDPLAALALAAWIQNFDHAKWLAEQAIPRLADDEITTTRAIQYLNDAGLSSDAVKLIAKWTPEKTALASALEAARACSLSDDRDQAIKWLKPHFDSLSKDRRELARLVIECFRAGADAEGLRVFVRFKEAYPSTAGNTTEAWATLAAGLVGHAQGDKASLERVREASQWFEQNSGTYGWKREGHFGWAIASQFLRDQGQETTLAPVDIYRFALGENDLPFAYAAYEKIDPFSKLLDALAKAENTPELDSADLYLGRILHQWFSGDVEGARVSWKMLLEFDDRFDDPEFRAGLQLWPYELQAIEKIVAGKDNWMEEVEIPDDTQEWGAVGIPDPEVLADLTDDTSEYTLAGRILHLSMLGDHLNAVATARLLLMRNPAWAETAHLESEGWDPEEIALFLSAIDQAQSTPSSP
ncbi:MAG: WD40 repeat domain-containing protein [Akkermansiaceae bacterium]|nr:WD40 repeat domain-containing protein [Akkermansiaceae bacterium]